MISFLISTVLVGLLLFWLHRRLVVAPGLTGTWARVADGVLIVLSVCALLAFQVGGLLDPSWARPIGVVGFTWAGIVFYLIWGTLAIWLVATIVRVAAWARWKYRRDHRAGADQAGADQTGADQAGADQAGAEPGGVVPAGDEPEYAPAPRRGQRAVTIATAVLVVAAPLIAGYGLISASRPTLVETTATIEDLPEPFEGARIALLTDLHVGPTRGADFTASVVRQVNDLDPDLVVISGDLVDGSIAHVGDDLRPLADLDAPLGVYMVSGNHEFYVERQGEWLDFYDEIGVTPLRNERVELRRDGAAIDLAGVQDHRTPAPLEPDYAAALAGRDESRPVILLAHQPKQAEFAAEYGVDLQLSGHTHGGQIWPFGYFVGLDQPIVSGSGEVDGVPVYVSRGAGTWGPPMRVAAPPEITLITLRGTRGDAA